MFVFSSTGFIWAWLSDLLYSDSPQFVRVFLFGGIWILQTALTLLTTGAAAVQSLLFYAPLSALLTALVFGVLARVIGIRDLTVFRGKRGLT